MPSIDFQILRAAEFKTTLWSGGTSTQLYISPSDAQYKELNFDFRLSTAKVESEISSFTSLPAISRKIMILEGSIEIKHENRYAKKLNKFDVDNFEGDWKTTSAGKCTDFNLMTRNGTSGSIKAHEIEKSKILNYSISKRYSSLFVYIFLGTISIELNNKNEKIHQGDLLVIKVPSDKKLSFRALQNSELIFTEINQSI
ncbi:MAG: HutD family protein [Bacteroidales bacterium]|nr:HutD family protein [Bacteroidales bacterium]